MEECRRDDCRVDDIDEDELFPIRPVEDETDTEEGLW